MTRLSAASRWHAGMPAPNRILKKMVKLLGSIWAQLEHHVCTRFEMSDKSYSSTLEKLVYGIGQVSYS
jgi:hypothetical protein